MPRVAEQLALLAGPAVVVAVGDALLGELAARRGDDGVVGVDEGA